VTDTIDPPDLRTAPHSGDLTSDVPGRHRSLLQVLVTLACVLLGFLLVAQVRTTEEVGERLVAEREEDLARILADLSAESDRLQSEITELRLLLIEFETSQESEEVLLRSLERRLDDLQILAGVVAAEGEGIVLTIHDPAGQVTHDLLVDVIQELRDAGAEAIEVNGQRLVASSSFSARGGRLLVDGSALSPPYRIAAIGPGDTLSKAMDIPGGVIDTLESRTSVRVAVDVLAEMIVPARGDPTPFVFGRPAPTEEPG
jgi:uncharacterized protein YlxW (UPF0749 family)